MLSIFSCAYWPSVYLLQKVKVKVAQLHPALRDPMDYAVCEILQAKILE